MNTHHVQNLKIVKNATTVIERWEYMIHVLFCHTYIILLRVKWERLNYYLEYCDIYIILHCIQIIFKVINNDYDLYFFNPAPQYSFHSIFPVVMISVMIVFVTIFYFWTRKVQEKEIYMSAMTIFNWDRVLQMLS